MRFIDAISFTLMIDDYSNSYSTVNTITHIIPYLKMFEEVVVFVWEVKVMATYVHFVFPCSHIKYLVLQNGVDG